MKFVSLLPEEESDDGHEGGGGEDNLCPLVLHHHAPPCPALAPLPHPAQVGGMVCRHLALGVNVVKVFGSILFNGRIHC